MMGTHAVGRTCTAAAAQQHNRRAVPGHSVSALPAFRGKSMRGFQLMSCQKASQCRVYASAQADAGPGKLISKVEVPAFIPRPDISDQLLRWALIELQEGGVANVGCPCKVRDGFTAIIDGACVKFACCVITLLHSWCRYLHSNAMMFYLALLSVFLKTERPILMSELLLTTSLPQSMSGLAGAQVCYRVRSMLLLIVPWKIQIAEQIVISGLVMFLCRWVPDA